VDLQVSEPVGEGPVDHVRDQAGVDRHGLEHERVHGSLRRFAEEVMPRVKPLAPHLPEALRGVA
jgi:hypothetical protein